MNFVSRRELEEFVELCCSRGLERAKREGRWSRQLYNAIGLYGQGFLERPISLDVEKFTVKEAAYIIGCAAAEWGRRVSLGEIVRDLVSR